MSKDNVTRCDSCRKIIESNQDTRHIAKVTIESDSYYDSVETTKWVEHLDFCPGCSRNLIEALNRAADALTGKKVRIDW